MQEIDKNKNPEDTIQDATIPQTEMQKKLKELNDNKFDEVK